MRKPDFKKVAQAVKASVSSETVFVHPLRDRTQLTSVTAATLSGDKSAYSCPHCKTTVVASASGTAPYCVVCSHETTPVKASVKVAPPKDLQAFTAVECKHCKTVSIMETAAVTASAFHVHCPACGGHNDFTKSVTASASDNTPMQAPAEKPLVEPETVAEKEIKADTDPELQAPIASATDWPYAGEEKPAAEPNQASNADDTLPKEDSLDPKADAPVEFKAEDVTIKSDAMDTDGDIELEDLDDFNPDIDEKAAAEEDPSETPVESGHSELIAMDTPQTASGDEDDADDGAVTAKGNDEDEVKMTEPETGDSLADTLDMDDTQAGLSFETKAGRLVAMKAHIAIASLTAEGAGKNADIMRTRGFQTALTAMARTSGMRRTLVAAGFKMVRVPVVTKATVERRVREAVEASAAGKARELATMSESLAIAAAGLSRGQWKGKENPLLAAFTAELKTAGVRNPERVVSRVLAENVVPFTRTLVEIASDVSKLSDRGRKETAALLEMTTPTAITSSAQDEDEGHEDDLETRLNTTAAIVRASVVPTTRSNRQDITAAAAQDSAARILSGELPLVMSI